MDSPAPSPPPPDQIDPALLLPRDTYWLVVHTLQGLLPPPTAETPDAEIRRDRAAIAEVAAMLPGNAEEASLAAHYVANKAYAAHCLHFARLHQADLAQYLKCLAQSARMTREAKGLRLLLQRLQAERRKREADPAATDRAAWVEHCAIGLMLRELPAPAAATTEPDPPAPAATQEPMPETPPAAPLTAAELYAVMYPHRAALIRRLGRVPDDVSFGPPDEELVRALVTEQTPALLALDRQAADTG